MSAWVFGYASLVALSEPGALSGRLHGYRRHWGVAMDNWEGGEEAKHWLDRESGERPHIRVAYLDISPQEPHVAAVAGGGATGEPAATVNGLALPVDDDRLAALDAREVNYERIEVSDLFEPTGSRPTAAGAEAESAGVDIAAGSARGSRPLPLRVFTYIGTEAAHERCRYALADSNGFIARDYLTGVRAAFAALGDDALAEFDRTTDPSPFPLADLRVVLPEHLLP